jgi:signal peptidase II
VSEPASEPEPEAPGTDSGGSGVRPARGEVSDPAGADPAGTDPTGGSSPVAPAVKVGIAGSLAAALGVVVADQLTKTWAEHRLSGGRTIHILGSLRLALNYNSGMAFSRARGFGPVIGTVGLVVVVVLIAGLRQAGSRASSLALGLVAGGAVGNILDRLFRSDSGFLRGEVIDFVDLQWWPVFNVADAAIVIGGLAMVLLAWRSGRARAS